MKDTNATRQPSFRRCTVETLPGRNERGWLAGYDAFEHAIVLIDGETSLRSFHPSKVK